MDRYSIPDAFPSAVQCSVPQTPDPEPERSSPELSPSRLEGPGVLSDQHFPHLSYSAEQLSTSPGGGSSGNGQASTHHGSPHHNLTASSATSQRTLVPTYDHGQSSFDPQSAFINSTLQRSVSLAGSTEAAATSLPLPHRFASQISSTTSYRSPTYAALYHQTTPVYLPGEMPRPIPRRGHESGSIERCRSSSPSTQTLLRSHHRLRQNDRETGNIGYTTFSVHPSPRSSSSGSSSTCGGDWSGRGCFPQNWVANVTGATEYVYSTIVSFGTHAAESTFPPIVNYLGGWHSELSTSHGRIQVSNHDGAEDSDSENLLSANQLNSLKSDDGLSFKTQESIKAQKNLRLGEIDRYADAEIEEENAPRTRKSKGKERMSAFLEDLPEAHRHKHAAGQIIESGGSKVGNTSTVQKDNSHNYGTEGLKASLATMFSQAELLEQEAENGKKRQTAAGVSILTQALSKLKGTERRKTLNTSAFTPSAPLQELHTAIIELGSMLRDWGRQEHVSIADTEARKHDPALYRHLLGLYEALRVEELDDYNQQDAPEDIQQQQDVDAGTTGARRQLDRNRECMDMPPAYERSDSRNEAIQEPISAESVPRSVSRHITGSATGMSTATNSGSGSRNIEGGRRRQGQRVDGYPRALLESLAEEVDLEESELAEGHWEEHDDAETSK